MRRFFGELENEVMRLVGSHPASTVADVQSRLRGEVAYTTVMTVLTRLWKKGELTRQKEGRTYLYSIASEKNLPSQPLLDRLRSRLFGGSTTQMVSYLIENGDPISDEEIAQIEALLHRLKES
jgi:predicted transcriptional regulator